MWPYYEIEYFRMELNFRKISKVRPSSGWHPLSLWPKHFSSLFSGYTKLEKAVGKNEKLEVNWKEWSWKLRAQVGKFSSQFLSWEDHWSWEATIEIGTVTAQRSIEVGKFNRNWKNNARNTDLAGVRLNSEIIRNYRNFEKYFNHFVEFQKWRLQTNLKCVGVF